MNATLKARSILTAAFFLATATIAACSQAAANPTSGAASARSADRATTEESSDAESPDSTRHERELRETIAREVGGLDKLTVPPDDASIPVPPNDPARPGRYQTGCRAWARRPAPALPRSR